MEHWQKKALFTLVISALSCVVGIDTALAESPPYIPFPSPPSGGGAPLPLLGGTLVGQAVVGAGGAFLLWRRRRRNAKKH